MLVPLTPNPDRTLRDLQDMTALLSQPTTADTFRDTLAHATFFVEAAKLLRDAQRGDAPISAATAEAAFDRALTSFDHIVTARRAALEAV